MKRLLGASNRLFALVSRVQQRRVRLLLLWLAMSALSGALMWGDFMGIEADEVAFIRAITPFHPSDIPAYFSPYWGFFYRPVFLTYFALVLWIFGANPLAYHVLDVLLHGANITLLVLLVARLSLLDGSLNGRERQVAVFGAGLVFALLSAHAQAVTWIASSSTVWATFFGLLCLHAWIGYRRHQKVAPRKAAAFYGSALLAFTLALCSKEDAAAFVLVLPLLDLALSRKRQFVPWVPFIAVFALYLPLAYIAASNQRVFSDYLKDGIQRDARVLPFLLSNSFLGRLSGGIERVENLPVLLANLGAVVYLAWKSAASRFAFLCWIACTLPLSVALGFSSMAPRFVYVSMTAAAALFALLWVCLGRERTSRTALTGAALSAGLLSGLVVRKQEIAFVNWMDFTNLWSLWLAALLAYVAWRAKRLHALALKMALLVVAGWHLDFLVRAVGVEIYPGVILAAVSSAALFSRSAVVEAERTRSRQVALENAGLGSLAAAFLWQSPGVSVTLFVVVCCLCYDPSTHRAPQAVRDMLKHLQDQWSHDSQPAKRLRPLEANQ